MPQERERGPRATALRGRSRRPRLTPPSRSREKMAPMRPPLALAARRSGHGTRTSTAAAAAAEEEDAEVEQQRRRRQCRRRLCGDEREVLARQQKGTNEALSVPSFSPCSSCPPFFYEQQQQQQQLQRVSAPKEKKKRKKDEFLPSRCLSVPTFPQC